MSSFPCRAEVILSRWNKTARAVTLGVARPDLGRSSRGSKSLCICNLAMATPPTVLATILISVSTVLGALGTLSASAAGAADEPSADAIVKRVRRSWGGRVEFGRVGGALVPIEVHLHTPANMRPRSEWPGDDVLADVARLTSLRVLSVANTRVTDRGLTACRGLVRLRTLDLSNSDIAGLSLQELGPLSDLRVLSLMNTEVSDVGFRRAPNFPKLESLDLSHTKITDDSLDKLSQYTSLLSLELRATETGTAGFTFLSHLKRLRYFNAAGTICTDSVWPRLAQLPDLRWLVLRGED